MEKELLHQSKKIEKPISRRDFLKTLGITGVALLAGETAWLLTRRLLADKLKDGPEPAPPDYLENQISHNSAALSYDDPPANPEPDTNPATELSEKSRVQPENFDLAVIDLSTPYQLTVPARYPFDSEKIEITEPMVVRGAPTTHQMESFRDWITYPHTSLGYLTNDPSTLCHFAAMIHSGVPSNRLPGELFREMARCKDPQIYRGEVMVFEQSQVTYKMNVTDFRVVTGAEFNNSVRTIDGKTHFIDVVKLGIPPVSVENNLALTLVFCVDNIRKDSQNNIVTNEFGVGLPVPGTISANRGLLTLELENTTSV
jgi:hypothetical protein